MLGDPSFGQRVKYSCFSSHICSWQLLPVVVVVPHTKWFPLDRGWSTVVFLVTFVVGSLLPVVNAKPLTGDSFFGQRVKYCCYFCSHVCSWQLLPVVVAVPHTEWFSLDRERNTAVVFLVTFVVGSPLPVVNTEPLTGSLFLWILDRGWNTAVVFLATFVVGSLLPVVDAEPLAGGAVPLDRGCIYYFHSRGVFSWRSATCPGRCTRCWRATRCTPWCTRSTGAGTPGCSTCSTASCSPSVRKIEAAASQCFFSLTVLWLREQREWEEKLTMSVFVAIESVA